MSSVVKLSCQCGNVQGALKVVKGSSFHVKCLCCDCQSYATKLNNEDLILDEQGGTELFQTYPAYLTITQGHEHIGCMQLSEQGIFRWHTTCCNTPLGNTMRSPSMPFVGISVKWMQFADEQEKERILGPVTMKVFGQYARGPMPQDASARLPLLYMPKMIAFMLKGMIGKKQSPSPFFKDGKPIVPAKIG